MKLAIGRYDVLREKMEAYNKEQLSIQDERITMGEERSNLSRFEETLEKQLEWAVQAGDNQEMEATLQRMEMLQQRRDELQKPQDIEKQPQISEEERDLVYEQLEQYEENLQKERCMLITTKQNWGMSMYRQIQKDHLLEV